MKQARERLPWFVNIALFLICGCAVTIPEGATNPSNLSPHQANLSEPAWVLDGTDLLPLADISLAPLPAQPAGKYRTEQGGAELYLSISGGIEGSWIINRTFQEPGVTPDIKTYKADRRSSALLSANEHLIIQGTKIGVLVLELKSGVESIPADYWIHYLRID